MRRAIPLVLLFTFAFAWQASAQIELYWSRAAQQGTHPNWFGEGSQERGMGYGVVNGQHRLYVASRSTSPAVLRIVDAETGSDEGQLSSTGVAGGTHTLSDVGVSDDGIIFASNLTLGAPDPFRLYRWDAENADPQEVITFTGDPGRLGDKITVTGSADDNSLEIWAAVSRANRVVRFSTADNGATFSYQVITLAGLSDAGINPSVAPLGDGRFYLNGSPWEEDGGMNPRLFNADGSEAGTVPGNLLETNVTRYFESGGRAYLALFRGRQQGTQQVLIYDVTHGPTAAFYVAETPSLGSEPNLFKTGSVHARHMEDGTVILYAMAANNGFAAFEADFGSLFAGTYYVGADGTAPGGGDPDFASLKAAFDTLAVRELTGPINLLITSDLDETGEDLVLSAEFTQQNYLVIRPAPGVEATVTLGAISADAGVDSQNSGLSINNTSWVTIDGSNSAGGVTRDLTFVLEDGTGTRVLSIVRGSENVTIRNTNVQRAVYHGSSEGIRVRRAEAVVSGLVPDNIVIQNNAIGTADVPVKDGVGLFGTNGLEVLDTYVRDNVIYAGHRGITTFYNYGVQEYTGNRIYVTGHQSNPAWYGGIYLAAVQNAVITGNEIVMQGANFTTEGRYVAGVVINVNLGEHTIANNMISVPSDFENRGTAANFGVYGIGNHRALGDDVYNIYHNSILIGDTGLAGLHAAIGHPEDAAALFATTTKTFDLKNNIFVNERAQANAFAIHWRVTTDGGFDSDYNNLYVASSQAFVGNWRGENQRALLDWQITTARDGNSVSTDVEFVSETDLRLTGASIGDTDLAGTPLAEVTEDIDGNVRKDRPYMGAHEPDVPVSVEDVPVAEVPDAFTLHQNYPNPFNPTTTISYTLSEPGHVSVRVYNMAGQLVQELVNEYRSQGTYEVTFDAGSMASGVYVSRMGYEGHVQTRRMVLVK
jgi:hypothetical protein